MKILHLADVHLDSPLRAVKDSTKRRQELLLSFCEAIEYGASNQVSAVLICGDLFDNDFVSTSTVKSVADLFKNYSQMQFFVLCGNHGGKRGYEQLKSLNLRNVHFFTQEGFSTYQLEDVAITAVELTGNDSDKYKCLNLPEDKYNIVMLHADTDSHAYGQLDLSALRQAGTNYLALGHRHTYSHKKTGKMHVVYCGVLECRGFDEREDTGVVLLDTQTNAVKFVKRAKRKVQCVSVDISNANSNVELLSCVKEALQAVNSEDYLNLTLTGTLGQNISMDFLTNSIKDDFFAFRLDDQTTIAVDLDKLCEEISLSSTFVKLVRECQFEDNRLQNDIIRMGLLALSGEELN